VVIVLAIGPKVRGFKDGRERWIFKGDTNSQKTFLRMRSKAVGPISLRFYGILKTPSGMVHSYRQNSAAISRQVLPVPLLGVTDATREELYQLGIVRAQMGSTRYQKMVAMHGTLCTILHRISKQYPNYIITCYSKSFMIHHSYTTRHALHEATSVLKLPIN
jgi:hypothetical protein